MEAEGRTVNRITALKLSGIRVSFWQLALVVICTGFVVFQVATFMRFPTPFVDEAWNANRSWALLHTGYAFGSMDAGVFERYPGYLNYFPWLGTAIHALPFWLFGASLFTMRLVSLLFGMILLASLFAIGRKLYSRRVGLLSAGIVACSAPFLYSSHLGRHDIIISALGFTALALYFTNDRTGYSWPAALSGLLVGLTLDIHPNGLLYIPVLVALYLFDYQLGVLRSKRFYSFVLGGLAAGIYFTIMHLLPNPNDYFSIFTLGMGSSRTPPLFSTDLQNWISTFGGTFVVIGVVLLPLILMSLVCLGLRHSRSDLRLLVLAGTLFVSFSALVRVRPPFYTILIFPAAGILVAVLIDWLLSYKWQNARIQYLSLVPVAALLVTYVLSDVLPMVEQDASGDYTANLALLRQTLPPSSSAMGSQTWGFAWPGQKYYSWDQLVYYPRSTPGATVSDTLKALKPDYFVIDSWMLNYFLTDDPAQLSKSADNPVVSRSQLMAFLDQHGKLVAHNQTNTFGYLNIYKLDWTAVSP